MIADGADLMIEAGPGTVLSGFMKRINRRIRTLHAEDVETVTNVLNTWEE
ncbi:malonyl CoA-acyl carrier protein transacylase [Dialister sp. CAG:588]|nr:malonyl CoA-acyl carrier protein transacylase [Dialister sp. CAG:588]